MTSPLLLSLARKLRGQDLMKLELRDLQLNCLSFSQSRHGTRDELVDRLTFAIWQDKYTDEGAAPPHTPITMSPDPISAPDHYVVQIHTYICTNCGATTQALMTYAAETLRHISAGRNGRYIPHMVPTREFTCNVPVRTQHASRAETAMCAVCMPLDGSTIDLSHLPRPAAPPNAHIVGGIRNSDEATAGGGEKSGRKPPRGAKVFDESILEF